QGSRCEGSRRQRTRPPLAGEVRTGQPARRARAPAYLAAEAQYMLRSRAPYSRGTWLRMASRRLALAFALAGSLAALPEAAWAAPVTIPTAVAELIQGQGQGLCVANAISTTPSLDFGPLMAGTYNAGMNAFMEAHKADRTEYVLRSIFDLSNNN